MSRRDYYDILGIARDADDAAMKKAYRSLAMQFHPDRNPGDDQAMEKMKEINEAYAVLSDREKRSLYDTYGHAGLEGFTQEDIFRGVDFASILEDLFVGGLGFGGSIFGSLFGRRGSRRARQARKGADLRYDLAVTLEDVVLGREQEIDISRVETCPACKGLGAKKDGLKECDSCRGTGQSVTEQRSGFGVFRQITTCSKCRGKGQIVTDPCEECGGRGSVERTKTVTVKIPRGADTGSAVRIEGEGEPGMDGAQSGDLYVVLSVDRHPVFERHGDDVYVAREIDFTQAALGAELDDVPGLEGDLKLEIPEGTQSGAVFRILGKGVPRLNGGGRGDEFVVVKVVTPTDLSQREKELLNEFRDLRNRRSG